MLSRRDASECIRSVRSLLATRSEIIEVMANSDLKRSLKDLVEPNDPSKGMRRMGMALLLSPDPLTDIPGAMLIISSFLIKRREPATPKSIFSESRKLLSCLSSGLL